MHQIEREILDVTSYKIQRKFSNRQDYLKSIFNAVQKLKNEEFDELTDEAATWANACVESYNRDRDADLPDFNETEDSDHEDEADEAIDDDEVENEDDDLSSPEADSRDDDEDQSDGIDGSTDEDEQGADAEPDEPDEDESEEVTPPKKKKPKPEKKSKIIKKIVDPDEEDVELDKWGSMLGSKNSKALSMFEKGATAGEVKDQLGGTYYNILKKMVSHGHKLEKKGAVIKLIHMTEKSSRLSAPKRSKK